MIPTVHIVSKPIGAVARLLYTHSSIIDPEDISPKNVKKDSVKEVLDIALEFSEQKKFKDTMEVYSLYMNGFKDDEGQGFDGFFDNIQKLRGKQFIFLDFQNLCLENKYGSFQKQCIDDFSTLSETADYLMDIFEDPQTSDTIRDAMKEIVFYRLSTYDFPFMIGDNPSTKIHNPLSSVVDEISGFMEDKKKRQLGSQERFFEDISTEANYKFSLFILSQKHFNELSDSSIESMLDGYNKHLKEEISMDHFLDLNKAAIAINREIVRMKYEWILGTLDIESPLAYMLQGDVGRKILLDISPNTGVIGEKLLHDTKNLLQGGVLEPQALNKFTGWLKARYDISAKPIIVSGKDTQQVIEKESSVSHPYTKSLAYPDELSRLIDCMDQKAIKLLEQDVSNFQFGVEGIELAILRLNQENFLVHTDNGDTQWLDLTKDCTIQPYSITDVSENMKKIIRPSNTGSKCEFYKFISIFPRIFWSWVKDNEAAISGNALHTISNELKTRQHELLSKYDILPLEREDYCEVPILHRFSPSDSDLNLVENHLLIRLSQSNNEFYNKMLHKLEELKDEGRIIIDGGQPDGMAVVEQTGQPVVIDFKRRMASYYPVQYFYEQTARYGLAIIQAKELDVDSFYTVIIQTPFHPNKFSGKTSYDKGIYRNQTFRIRKTDIKSQFAQKVKRNMILEYLGNQLFIEDVSNGLDLVKMYRFTKPHSKFARCDYCFGNSEGSERCSYLLTGRTELWDGQKIDSNFIKNIVDPWQKRMSSERQDIFSYLKEAADYR